MPRRSQNSSFRYFRRRRPTLEALEARRLLVAPHPVSVSSLDGNIGYAVWGRAAGDDAGRAVATAGDVTGDGFADLLIGADGADPAGDLSGEAYLLAGAPTRPGPEVDLNGSGVSRFAGAAAYDQAGLAVSGLGDVNGDGFADFAIGALGSDSNGTDAGRGYVVFGGSGALPTSLDSLDGTQGFAVTGAAAGDFAGTSIAGAGDVNRDGYADVLVGAPRDDSGGSEDAGAAYLLFGRPSGFAAEVVLDGSAGLRIMGAAAEDSAGFSVDSAGDFNGDGFDDMLVGAYGAGLSGAAYVLFGGDDLPSTISLAALDGEDGVQLIGAGAGEFTGFSVAGVGDINGDGFDDVIVGAYLSSPDGRNAGGRSYVVFGRASAQVDRVELGQLDGTDGFALLGAAGGDESGRSVSGAGDVNGDGYDDLLIGARSAAPAGLNDAGSAYLVFGKLSGFAANLDLGSLDGAAGFRIDGAQQLGSLGLDVAAAGDVDGDGFDDLAVSAPGASPEVERAAAGEVYVLFGDDFLDTATQLGDASANLLQGDSQADVIVAGAGDDTLVGAGGSDVLRGGAGDDVLAISDMGFRFVRGGSGTDTLRVDGSGLILDLRQLADNRITGIERIDIVGSGSNTLEFTVADVLNLSDESNQLLVRASDNDDLGIGAGWAEGPSQTVDGERYRTFTQGAATLLVLDMSGPPWQNPVNPLDVSGDSFVAPVADVLPLINELNQPTIIDSLGNLPLPPTAPNLPPPFYDVSGDGRLTPVADVLPIINFLNSAAGGEGEAGQSEFVNFVPRVSLLNGETLDRPSHPVAETVSQSNVPVPSVDPLAASRRLWAAPSAEDWESLLDVVAAGVAGLGASSGGNMAMATFM